MKNGWEEFGANVLIFLLILISIIVLTLVALIKCPHWMHRSFEEFHPHADYFSKTHLKETLLFVR
jgi:hypothetical protein